MTSKIPTSQQFLNEAYIRLGYQEGSLLDAVISPTKGTKEENEWLEKGEWLSSANKAGAEKVFFVNNDPVIIFSKFDNEPNDKDLLNAFRKAWCMARPLCLFLAFPGELRVYSLNRPPARNSEEWQKIASIEIVNRISDVAEKLNNFHRGRIESYLFIDNRFGNINERADKRLIQDLKKVRTFLIKEGLSPKHAHALIGRSIFIRYLEDRGIITTKYFNKIAANNKEWSKILSKEPEKPVIIIDWEDRRYDRVLNDKKLTYALFKQLSIDFNGDLFPQDAEEEENVEQKHLNMIRSLLLGDTDIYQSSLFFWAYDFKIIPIELISNLYEVFYQDENKDDSGTHYTPSVLVEFILSHILTEDRLAKNPKILDPACGSGIFLVEAFRRIVRFRTLKQKNRLSAQELRRIVQEQIRGIDTNADAIKIAAFSLYVALLHYQEPPDILSQINDTQESGGPLPKLISKGNQAGDNFVLYNINAFGFTDTEVVEINNQVNKYKSKPSKKINTSNVLPIKHSNFDVIVGNPPWGSEKKTNKENLRQLTQWCSAFNWTIGDTELSQAFIARTINLLKPDGECGLLVSSGVLFKHNQTSTSFRERFYREIRIKTVVNFSHVRREFFHSSISPFIFIRYQAKNPSPDNMIRYWSVKKNRNLGKIRSFMLNLSDLHQIRQYDIRNDNSLWKIYWWGSHRDANLIRRLYLDKSLQQLSEEKYMVSGQGYKGATNKLSSKSADWLKNYKELPIGKFNRYGSISNSDLIEVPDKVHALGKQDLYDGWRILIRRTVKQARQSHGRIIARLENKRYCFRSSIHGIKVDNCEDWKRKIIIGIFVVFLIEVLSFFDC